jgi:hypothetical protein
MASTYSALKIELIGTGEQSGTWGTTTNNNLGNDALGEAITGSADVAFSSADVTVTLTDTNASQAARNLRLNLTGTSGGARNLILGSGCQIEKLYLINNGLADAVTVKNTSGSGIAVAAGKSMFVYNDGTNVVDAVTQFNGTIALASGVSGVLPIANGGTGTSSTTFTNLTTNVTGTLPIANGGTGSTSTTFVNAATNITGTLPIANGGTGSTSTTFVNAATNITGTLPIANGGTGTTSTTFTNLTTNVTGTLPIANGGTGLTALGTANQVLAVNAGATALEYQTASGGQLQTALFTSPGTWTKPASTTTVRVTVIGGGGGGSEPNTLGAGATGGTSSFGPAVSATGGTGANRPPGGGASAGTPGAGTVSVGTAIKTFAYGPGAQEGVGYLLGLNVQAPAQPGVAFSTSSPSAAGSGSQQAGPAGTGGIAVATVPVSAPVAITIGAGGAGSAGPAKGGIGGAILVEFVG